MTRSRLPALYVSHGSPMLVLDNSAAKDFLSGFGKELGRPEAIVVASAHFETETPSLSADERPAMIYDFGGFPRALYEMTYPAPGDPLLAQRAAAMLTDAGLPTRTVTNRGFDHGAWVPLKLLYPEADIPIVEISVQPHAGALHHVALGRALAPLREEGVLLMGSGSLTHNLSQLPRYGRDPNAPAPDWVSQFGDWANERIAAGDLDAIADYRERAPFARENHPTEEHFLPLPFAIGAGGDGARGKRVHSSHQYGILMMDAYAFD